MTRTEDITSVTEHRSRMRDHLRQVKQTGRPMFITTNGETEAVVLSPAAYDELAGHAELARGLKMVEDSMADIAAGRTRPVDESFDAIDEAFERELARRAAPLNAGA